MRKLFVVFVAALIAATAVAASASATIHPLMVGWVCGNASGEPPGQTPGETHSDQSTFRALQATGVIVGMDPTTGLPIFDFNNPAVLSTRQRNAASSVSAGVLKPSVSRGRVLSLRAIASSWGCV
jgi:hypothetical protein